MGIVNSDLFSAANVHGVGNILLALLYLLVFLILAKHIITSGMIRNVLAVSTGCLFLLAAFAFFSQSLYTFPWKSRWIELAWLILACFPVAYFLWMVSKRSIFSVPEESLPSRQKFDKLKHEFLSVASHELRTPLSVINGFAEILVREKLGPLNDEQKRRVRKILLQGQRLNHIIDELLDLSRIRSGKMDIRRDVFDMIPVLKACIDDHMIVCEQQNIGLLDRLPDVLPDVVGDLDRITQVVVNLLNNSIKYTDPGGTVTLSAFYEKEKGRVRVEVTDTGIGIDPEDQVRVFEEFYRASQKHTKKYSGSGLGLAIVKQLIECQGGEVGVYSKGLNEGSQFFFTLPAVRNHQAASTKTQLYPPADKKVKSA